MTDKKLCYSLDDEHFNYESLVDLMDELAADGELKADRVYYEADCTPITHEYIVSANRIEQLLEQFDTDLFEEIGEIEDNDYSRATKEAKAELRGLVLEWAKKHVQFAYWRIDGKTRKKQFTAAEVAEFFA